jgi:Dolichyl-phosphate-mannose-protein mannosyltransferase
MFCLLITCALFLSCYYFLTSIIAETPLRKILIACGMTCAQIILTELLLGLGKSLHVSYLVAANLLIAALLLFVGTRCKKNQVMPLVKSDIVRIGESFTSALDSPAVILGILLAMTYGWITVAAYYLPPRGIDDLAYHLPPIFEYIQSHEIKLLPVELRHHFAFPENAELLFMWPTLFAGNQRLVDGLNVPFVLLSILTLYALIRHFDLSGKDAFFAAMLYALCPVVIMQAGVNYIDILVALFFLLSLYFSVLFHSGRRLTHLFAAGMFIGLLCGMKYTAVFLVLPLQLLIVPGLCRVKWRSAVGYLALIMVFGSWWYFRNQVVLGDPFYPLNLLGTAPGKHGGGGIGNNICTNIRQWMNHYPQNDIGVGTYDGGFGLVFWCIGVSSGSASPHSHY